MFPSIHKGRGFTMIELMVAVAIIALLSAVILATVSGTKIRTRDAERLSDIAQIIRALELYNSENGQYPPREVARTNNDPTCGNAQWDLLASDLAPYIEIPCDPLGLQTNYLYYYDADVADGYQTYGLMVRLESPGNFSKASGDAGFSSYGTNGSYYEVGQQPSYCASKSQNWWESSAFVCQTSN